MPRTKINVFTVDMARTYARDNMAEMRRQYTAYRDIAQKRIARLGESFANTQAYRQHAQGFAKLKDLSPKDLPKAFSELSKFLGAKASTVSGQRQIRAKTIRTFREQGLDVDDSNYDWMIKVFEEMRRQKLMYGSDKVVDVVSALMHTSESTRQDLLKHLDRLMRNSDKLATQVWEDDRTYTSEEVLSMLGDE